MSRHGNKKWIINSDSALCRHLGGLLMLLLTLAFFVQVTKPNNSHEPVKLYSLQKGLRWLKENVHLRERLEGSKSGKFNSWQSRNAFAAADHNVSRKPYIKNYKDSRQRDVLKNIISLIKEKEDATIQSSEPANVVFLLDGSGDIGFRELHFYKMFVKEVYNSIKRPPQGIKFGLFECGSLRHYNQHNILSRTIPNLTAIDRILDNLVPINGHCELGKSLQMINTNIFKRPTNDSPRAIVVVLAGHSLDNVTSAANKLNEEGVRIVAFGAGDKADMDQLVTLTVSPLYAFKVPAFEYLPSMSSTAVGFLDKVIEPRYVNNIDSSSQKLDEERAQAGYQNEYGNMNYPLLGSNYENGMHPNFGPTLGEPTGGYSDSWSFLTQSGTQEPVQSKVFQNSQTTSEDSNEEETFVENKQSIGPTLPQDGTHFKDGSVENAQDLSENINSTTQSPENQGQSSINKTKPEGKGQPGNVNQGNSGAGAIPSTGEVIASKNVAASSANSGNLAGSPGNPTGSGSLVNNGKVSTGTGSTGTNGGSFRGGAANTVGGAASNSGQQALTGLVQAIQTQLLPVPVIPVQTIPIQPLPSVVIPPLQTHVPANNAGSMTNQQPPGGNMPPIPQNASNEKPKESNPESKVSPSTENSNENKTPAELSEKPNGTLKKPVPGYQLPSKAPGSQVPTKSTEGSKSSKKQTTKSAPSSHSTCLPGNENSPTPRPNASCPTLKKPTSVPSAQGARTKPTPDKKPTSTSTTPYSNHNSMPQIVLCQVICGSDCCSPKVKTSQTQSTPTTKPTTESTTEPKSENKSKPTEAADVMAGPPLPLRYPPCLPKNTHHLLACQLQWPVRPLPPSDTFPMYMTLPPATASPLQMEKEKETKGNLLGGQCQDFHPDCPAFVMSRMCDQETPFKDVFNVREVCMLSCGVCNSLVEQGTNLTFKKREKGRRPEDMGFPEYSKKFLKRHALEAQNSS